MKGLTVLLTVIVILSSCTNSLSPFDEYEELEIPENVRYYELNPNEDQFRIDDIYEVGDSLYWIDLKANTVTKLELGKDKLSVSEVCKYVNGNGPFEARDPDKLYVFRNYLIISGSWEFLVFDLRAKKYIGKIEYRVTDYHFSDLIPMSDKVLGLFNNSSFDDFFIGYLNCKLDSVGSYGDHTIVDDIRMFRLNITDEVPFFNELGGDIFYDSNAIIHSHFNKWLYVYDTNLNRIDSLYILGDVPKDAFTKMHESGEPMPNIMTVSRVFMLDKDNFAITHLIIKDINFEDHVLTTEDFVTFYDRKSKEIVGKYRIKKNCTKFGLTQNYVYFVDETNENEKIVVFPKSEILKHLDI